MDQKAHAIFDIRSFVQRKAPSPQALAAVPPFPIPPHPPGVVGFHAGLYDELTPPGVIEFLASIDSVEWRNAAEALGVSAGTIIQVTRRSPSSSYLKISIDPSGPFAGWGYCKLLPIMSVAEFEEAASSRRMSWWDFWRRILVSLCSLHGLVGLMR